MVNYSPNVDESNRSWCTSSAWCDNRAITIEVANSRNGGNWPVSDRVLKTLIELVTDNGKRGIIFEKSHKVLQTKERYYSTAISR